MRPKTFSLLLIAILFTSARVNALADDAFGQLPLAKVKKQPIETGDQQSQAMFYPQAEAMVPHAARPAEIELARRLSGEMPTWQIGTQALVRDVGLPRVVYRRSTAPPAAHLVTDSSGRYYARCIPEAIDKLGTTTIYQVESEGDKVIDRYHWFERFRYPGQLFIQQVGYDPNRATPIIAILRMHNDRNAESREKQVELSLYLQGKCIESFTTKQLQDLGADVKTYTGERIADGDYAVYKFNGFDASNMKDHIYGCFSITIGDKIFLIDIAKGDVVQNQ